MLVRPAQHYKHHRRVQPYSAQLAVLVFVKMASRAKQQSRAPRLAIVALALEVLSMEDVLIQERSYGLRPLAQHAIRSKCVEVCKERLYSLTAESYWLHVAIDLSIQFGK